MSNTAPPDCVDVPVLPATVNDVEVISAITAAQINQTLATSSVDGLSGIA